MDKSMKQISIMNYISKINFNRDNWSLKAIKEDMRRFLGEEPGIEIVYMKDVMLNEDGSGSKEIEKVETISIVFTDLDDKLKRVEFKID
jgi:hypothetical protein